MITTVVAPGPAEPVTGHPPPGADPVAPPSRVPSLPCRPSTVEPTGAPDRHRAQPPSTVDLTGAFDRAAGARRRAPASEGGAWMRLPARARAEAEAGGRPAGPLQRTVVAVKDVVAVAGLPLGAGSRARAGAPPEPRDAAVVAALRAAGAVVAGTVALHEMAFGVSGINDEIGFPGNSHDPARVPGGSSSGSAVAVAEATCDLAVGTDTGGSARIPAALCGVVGFKAGRSRYPLAGVLPLAPTLDTVGLLARSVGAVVAAHRALTGEAVRPVEPGERLRIGVERSGLAAADPPVAAAVDDALAALARAGCELVEVDWPDRTAVLEVSTTVMFAEAAAVHRELLAAPEADLLGTAVAARFRAGAALTEDDHRAALRAAGRLEADARRTLATVDAVVGPTVPVLAPPVEAARRDEALPCRLVAETRLANLAGLPALTVPAPAPGLPVGLQVTAASDARALAIGGAIAARLAGTGPARGGSCEPRRPSGSL